MSVESPSPEPRDVAHPARTPHVVSVMDEFGARVVVLFACERCGGAQRYVVLEKVARCAHCDGAVRNDSTAA